jgi:hypothetical protein
MPFKWTKMASNVINLDTASRTIESVVKNLLKATLNIIITVERTTLIIMLFPLTTKTDNFVTLG